jgi:acyl carrier protein
MMAGSRDGSPVVTTHDEGVGGDVSEELLRIYRETLDGDPSIELTGDFLEIAGDSVMALELIGRIEDEFGVRVPPPVVFTASSLGEIAAYVEQAREQQNEDGDVIPDGTLGAPGIPGTPGTTGPCRASMAQEWAYLAALDTPSAPAPRLHAAYLVRGRLDLPALRTALQAVTAAHPALRTGFRPAGGQVVQSVAEEVAAVLDVEDFVGDFTDHWPEAESTLRAWVRRPFDRSRPPLARTLVIRYSDDAYLLGSVFDRLVADSRSLDVFVRDLTTAYAAALAGEPIRLPRPGGTHQEWSLAQWRRWESGRAEELTAYWGARLGPEPEALRLPGHVPGSGAPEVPAALDLDAPDGLAEALPAAADALRTTPQCVAMAALKALIAHETGRRRVTLVTGIPNRLDTGCRGTIGWFATTVLPTTDVDTGGPFTAVVRAVHETVLEAQAHGDAPAAYVHARLWPGRAGGFRREPTVSFAYTEPRSPDLALPGATVEPYPLEEDAESPGLHVRLRPGGGRLRLQVLHHESEYPAAYVHGFAGRYLAALEALVREPGTPVREVLAGLRPPAA